MEEPIAQVPGRPGQRDLTAGPIGSALLMFALPTLASNVLQSLNGSINAIWVGRFLGEGPAYSHKKSAEREQRRGATPVYPFHGVHYRVTFIWAFFGLNRDCLCF